MRIYPLLITVLVTIRSSTPFATPTLFAISKEIVKIVQSVLDVQDRIDQEYEDIMIRLDNIPGQINELTNQLQENDRKTEIVFRLLNNRLELNLIEIRSRQINLNKYYTKMANYIADYDEYENITLINFANQVVSPSESSVTNLIDFVHQKVTETHFLKLFSKQLRPDAMGYFCKQGQSLPQTLQSLLMEILMMNVKSYSLIQTAYILKKLHGTGNFTKEMEVAHEEFQSRTENLTMTFKPYIARESLEFWKCDPEKHAEGETFVEITNFLHGYILNKVNLEPHGRCSDQCDNFTYTTKTQCYDNEWCKKQKTCPKIIGCQYVDQSMDVHYSNSMVETNRRYDYINFENGERYGKQIDSTNMNHLETYRNWLIYKCSYCFCLCDEGPKYFSHRYINLRVAMSNIRENKVVTGLRFIKNNNIIHLQVQEGKVMSNGRIDMDTVRWVPPENYSRTDNNVTSRYYHTLSWEQRGFELTDIMAEPGHVVTGVRFLEIGTRLHLEALTTPYDFTSGELTPRLSYFQEDKDLFLKHKFGKELKLKKPDVPTSRRSTDVTTNRYVQFTHTDFKEDAGQTTVPFFDAQPVASTIPVPLSGVGVFHRGRSGSGGFIAPKIFTYNFTQHLESLCPESTSRVTNLTDVRRN